MPPRPRDGSVVRPRLLERIRSSGAPVVLAQAPAGYGKTTLLTQALGGEDRPVAWLTLEERDNDPRVLLHDLAHALTDVTPPKSASHRMLTGLSSAPLLTALPALMEWLRDRAGPVVLVLDDVHVLRSDGALDVVHALCAGVPAESRLLLGSRTRPPLHLARLRADGRLWELTAADLRMTRGEGAAMLQAAGVDVDRTEARVVVDRTEGWAAAIYLAALIMRESGAADVDRAPTADDASLAEYVREEVLALLDAQDADFLLRCSVLDEFRADICDAVLQRDDAALRLRALARDGLFVTTADGRRDAYRIHGLFRALLHAELVASDPAGERALQRRARDAYRDAGDTERALAHALAAGDVPSAADLIAESAAPLISQGRSATLRRWCAQLHEADLVAYPQAAVARGWAALQDGDGELAAHCATIACGAAPGLTTPGGDLVAAQGLLLRASIAADGRAQALRDAVRADEGLHAESPPRASAQLVIGSVRMLDGDTDGALEALRASEQLAAGRLAPAYSLALTQQALIAIDAGHWERAEALVERAWLARRTTDVRAYSTQALAIAGRAFTLAHGGDTARAREDADDAARSLALLEPIIPWLALETRLLLARTRILLGDTRQARELLRESRTALDADDSPLLRDWAASVAEALERTGGDGGGPALTSAELRVLHYLPTHMPLGLIGERLHLSRNTVKSHTAAIYRKLGASSRAEAVARGRDLGLLDG